MSNESENLDCSICGNEIGTDSNGWSGGNNAHPINDGRCCHLCDCMIVIPIRLMGSSLAAYKVDEEAIELYKQTALLGIHFLVQRINMQQKPP